MVVDSTDRGGSGCRRPAPALFADSSNGNVHIAYFIEPPGGSGIFVIHSMDSGSSFHSPVAVAFGSRPSATAVSAEGDRVAVAYLQPMGERSQVFVALSTTAGHIFESGIPVSEDNADARNPRVSLRGTKLEVSWTEHAARTSAPDRDAARTGVWK